MLELKDYFFTESKPSVYQLFSLDMNERTIK
jgi:hypothetical protein